MSFSRFVILCFMGSAASLWPKLMSGLPSSTDDPGSMRRTLESMQVQAAHGDIAADGQQAQELQRLLNTMAPAESGASDEVDVEKEFRGKAGLGSVQAPILAQLIKTLEKKQSEVNSFPDQVQNIWVSAQERYWGVRDRLKSLIWAAVLLSLVIGLLAFVLEQPGRTRFLAEAGYNLSRKWLLLLSLGVAALALVTGTNPWPAIPRELLLPPFLWLLGSAALYRLIDMNYPLWNRAVRGLMAPLLSMGFVLVYLKVSPLIPGL